MGRLLGHLVCLLLLSVAAAACAGLSSYLPAEPTASLAPWPSPTVTQLRPTPVPSVAATFEIGATATPFKHVVVQGETFLGIAFLYGLEEDALLLANPGIDPGFLSIGQELLVPGPEGTPIGSLIPTATPIPLALQPPTCYRQASGGAWCLAGIHNPTSQDLENLVVEFRLLDPAGEVIESAQVFPPLNRLPPGETMPVAAAFADAPPSGGSAVALVLSVIAAREVEGRYHAPEIVQTADDRQEGGLSWLIRGTIKAAPETPEANRTLVLLTAFDDANQVVGYAVWEAEPVLEPGDVREFAVRVFSLGPEIARIELMAESYGLVAQEE
jgi:LysM repeat protein